MLLYLAGVAATVQDVSDVPNLYANSPKAPHMPNTGPVYRLHTPQVCITCGFGAQGFGETAGCCICSPVTESLLHDELA